MRGTWEEEGILEDDTGRYEGLVGKEWEGKRKWKWMVIYPYCSLLVII